MLGCKQQRQPKLFYSSVNLDQRIRSDNPLRKIHNIIDFSFVRPQVEHFYGKRGISIDPIVLMKLMVILFLENIPSERELMRRLPERLDWLWFWLNNQADKTASQVFFFVNLVVFFT